MCVSNFTKKFHCSDYLLYLRLYTAATLEHSQSENDEGSINSLAAATIELERFFRKEDFGRMQVIVDI